MVMDNDISATFFKSNTQQLSNGFTQPTNPKSTVLIGVDDTGIDTLPSKFPTIKDFLLRTSKDFMCDSKDREGFFGANLIKEKEPEPIDTDGHGTFINGIIAGKAIVSGSRQDFIGSSDNVMLKIIHARFVSDRDTNASLFNALCGIHYSLSKGAKVINASWRAKAIGQNSRNSLRKALLLTLDSIVKKRAILVTGAGNDSLSAGFDDLPIKDNTVTIYPAEFSREPQYANYVIAVGALDYSDSTIAKFSNHGRFVDVYAPGVNIVSAYIKKGDLDGQAQGQGTSYAAPYISRLAAILIGKGVPVTNVKSKIVGSATPLPSRRDVKLLNHSEAVRGLR
jgi:subtilisin family serine protease